VIKLPIKIILLLHVLVVSSCSSLDVLKENYQNFLSTSSNKFYIVEEGDSIWSISIKLNLDPQLLISNNSLDKPYIIYPDQKLALYEYSNIQPSFNKDHISQWHHPLRVNLKPAKEKDSWLVYKESKGTPIHSIYQGKIVVAGPDIPGYGNLVMISHPHGYLSLYAHCDKIFVEQGDEVGKGAVIAHVGNSEAPQPMLRFQLRKGGRPVSTSGINFKS